MLYLRVSYVCYARCAVAVIGLARNWSWNGLTETQRAKI